MLCFVWSKICGNNSHNDKSDAGCGRPLEEKGDTFGARQRE